MDLDAGSHVLVLGGRRADLMGALIRRGCLAATCVRQGEKPPSGPFDVVIVPGLTKDDDLDRIVHFSWRALTQGGAFVACVAETPPNGAPGLELARRLRLHRFHVERVRPFCGQWLLRANLRTANTAVRG